MNSRLRLAREALSLFLDALDLPPEERSEYVAAKCVNRPELIEHVERLIDADGRPAFRLASAENALPPGWMDGIPVLDCYEAVCALGTGRMGMVYEANQAHPRRRVAIKIIQPGIVSPALVARFHEEVNHLARSLHPGIPQVYAVGEFETEQGLLPYLVMELVDGRPLLEYIDDERLDRTALLLLFIKIADAIQHAHKRGVIHRDIKPENILVSEQRENSAGEAVVQPKVLDFGVARTASWSLEQVGVHEGASGTPAYMSPEHRAGEGPDVRNDVFSLGMMLYEALTGTLPHVRAAGDEPPPRPSLYCPTCRGDLDAIVLKSIAASPEDRYQDARSLASDLESLINNEPVLARPPGFGPRRLVMWTRRHPVATIFVVILALSGALYLLARKQGREEAVRQDRARRLAVVEGVMDELRSGRTAESFSLRREAVNQLIQAGTRYTAARLSRELDSLSLSLERQPTGDSSPGVSPAHRQIAMTCCEVLGVSSEPETAVPSLARYLRVAPDEKLALVAGRSLCKLSSGSPDDNTARAIRKAGRRFGRDSLFFTAIALRFPSAGAIPDFGDRPEVREIGRTPHGEIESASGQVYLDPVFTESQLGLGLPPDAHGTSVEDELWARYAVKRKPGHAASKAALGAVLAQMGQLEEGIRELTAAIELDPQNLTYIANRGEYRKLAGLTSLALEDFSLLVERAQPSGFWRRGFCRLDGGDPDGALLDFRESIARDEVVLSARVYSGMAWIILNRNRLVVEDLSGLPETDLPLGEGLHVLGAAYLRRGDVEASVRVRRQAIQLESTYALGWNGLAVSMALAGDRKGAFAALKKGREQGKHLPFAWVNQAALKRDEGDLQGAIADLTAAIERCPQLPTAWYLRALTFAEAGDWERAELDYRSLLKLDRTYQRLGAIRMAIERAGGLRRGPSPHFR